MKRSLSIVIVGIISLSGFLVSCASTPKPEPEPVPEAEQAQARALQAEAKSLGFDALLPEDWTVASSVLSEADGYVDVDNLKAKETYIAASSAFTALIEKGWATSLATASKKAMDAREKAKSPGFDSLLSEDWAAAETVVTRADGLAATSTSDAITAYGEAATAFDAIFAKGWEQTLSEAKTAAGAIRDDAAAMGYDVLLPDDWKSAEDLLVSGDELAKTDAAQAVDVYRASGKAFTALVEKAVGNEMEAQQGAARKAQTEAQSQGFAELLPEDWKAAVDALARADALAQTDKSKARSAYAEASKAFAAIVVKGWTVRTETEKQVAVTVRNEADVLKARVAVKDLYLAAEQVQLAAQKAFDNRQFSQAMEGFKDAAARFTIVRDTAQQKRDTALSGLQKVTDRLTASESGAAQAQSELDQLAGEAETDPGTEDTGTPPDSPSNPEAGKTPEDTTSEGAAQ